MDFLHDKANGHPTQKPVALMRYFVETYTNPGDVVLDFAMGSGTTGAACMSIEREFIGIEKDEYWFHFAEERIQKVKAFYEGSFG